MKSPINAIMPGIITFFGGVGVALVLVYFASRVPRSSTPPVPDIETTADAQVASKLSSPVFGAKINSQTADELSEKINSESGRARLNNNVVEEKVSFNSKPEAKVVYDLRGVDHSQSLSSGSKNGFVRKDSSSSEINVVPRSTSTRNRASAKSPKFYKVPAPRQPAATPFVSIRAAKELYKSRKLTKTEYKIMIERLENELDLKINRLKADYRAGKFTKTEYKIAVERIKVAYKG